MRRRTFLAALPAAAFASTAALAQSRAGNPNLNRPDVRGGDRIDGATFASRSAAWGIHGAARSTPPSRPTPAWACSSRSPAASAATAS